MKAMAEPLIHARICDVMASVGAIGKNQRNKDQGFMFRGIDDALNAVHPALVEHGVHYVPEVLSHEVERYQTSRGTQMKAVTVTVAYTFFAPDGSSVRVVTMGEAADAGDKAVGKAQSVALKFALLHALCIPTQDMGDADHESHERAAPLSPDEYAASLGWQTAAEQEERFTFLRTASRALAADRLAEVKQWATEQGVASRTMTKAQADTWEALLEAEPEPEAPPDNVTALPLDQEGPF